MKLKNILKYSSIIGILLVITTYFSGWPFITSYNNYQTNAILNNIKQIVISNNTKVINPNKRFGILFGNGNHCDCEVSALVETNLESKQFEKQFKESLDSNLTFTRQNNSLILLFSVKKDNIFFMHKNEQIKLDPSINNYNFPCDGFDSNTYKTLLKMTENVKQKSNKNYYIITITEQINSGFRIKDYRCH